MDLCFNELSFEPLSKDYSQGYKRILNFVKTFKAASIHNFNMIRYDKAFDEIEIYAGYTLNDFCCDNRNKTLASLLLGSSRYPYLDKDSEEETQYIENEFYLIRNGGKTPTIGLSSAYLYDTIGIGFLSEPFWESFEYEIEIAKEGTTIKERVLCASIPDHINSDTFNNWKEAHTQIELISCNIEPDKKGIKISPHHGSDELMAFAKKLVKSKLIVKVINSLKFNSFEKKLIRKNLPNGVIEIVLYWTDSGYGLAIQTTGRNIRETEAIAKLLIEEYSE